MAEQEMQETNDYEIVPMSPLRKMEKRVDVLEENIATHKELKEMLDIVKANQKSVDDIVKSTASMLEKVSQLAAASSNIAGRMSDFLSRIEIEELPPGKEARGVTDFNERLTKLENRLNALVLLIAPRVRRPTARPAARSAIRAPVFGPAPIAR